MNLKFLLQTLLCRYLLLLFMLVFRNINFNILRISLPLYFVVLVAGREQTHRRQCIIWSYAGMERYISLAPVQVIYIYIYTPQIHLNFFTVYRQKRDKTGWAGPWSGSRH